MHPYCSSCQKAPFLIEYMLSNSNGYAEQLVGEEVLKNIDMDNAEMVALVNSVNETTVYVEKTVEEITIFVRQ